MVRAGRKVGVRRLSDFSRTAVFLGRRAETQGQPERAERAYDGGAAPGRLQPGRASSPASRFWRGTGGSARPLRADPRRPRPSLLSTHESRVAIFSSLGLWPACCRRGDCLLATCCLSRCGTDRGLSTTSARRRARSFGRGAASCPLGLHRPRPAALRRPRARVAHSLLGRAALGLRRPARARPSSRRASSPSLSSRRWPPGSPQENIRQRSPLFVAAIDLEERREDASAEDGLRQASAVFPGGRGRVVPARHLRRALRRPGAGAVRLRPRDAGRSRPTTGRS